MDLDRGATPLWVSTSALVWLALAASIVGCGGGSSSGSTTSSTTTTTITTTTSSTPATTTSPPTTTTTTPATTTTQMTTTTHMTTTTMPTPPTTAPGRAAEVVTRVDTAERVIALTFDAGSDRGYAEEILDLLKARGIAVTFGMTGRWAENNPDLLVRMIDEGHRLMNHTYDHPHMETLSSAQRLDQLSRTEGIIENLTGTGTKPFFRPPYGAYNNQVLADVAMAGYRYSIMWTVDSAGWKGVPPSEVVDRCLDGAAPGAIILFHVGAASTDYSALPAILDGLGAAGYRFATIPGLIP